MPAWELAALITTEVVAEDDDIHGRSRKSLAEEKKQYWKDRGFLVRVFKRVLRADNEIIPCYVVVVRNAL